MPGYCSDREVSAHARAARQARQILKPGDRLFIGTCGSRGVTVTMTGWSDQFEGFLTSKTLDGDELHPINIRKVNGKPVNFGELRW